MHSQRSTPADVKAALVPATVLFGGMALLLIGLLATRPSPPPAKSRVASESSQTVTVAFDPAKAKAGENNYQTTCSACHGFNAMGIPGLGKALIGIAFVNDQTDDQLLAFLQKGRDVTDPLNTTGVMMPARGGNPTFGDDKLVEVIAYIRSLNVPANQVAAAAAPTSGVLVATRMPVEFKPLDVSGLVVPNSVSGAEGSSTGFESASPLITGESLYLQSCSGCHAADGTGVQYVAKPLTESAVVQARNGIGLLNFLIDGDPTLNPPHPYRGGYPELSDADLLSIIGYLYGL